MLYSQAYSYVSLYNAFIELNTDLYVVKDERYRNRIVQDWSTPFLAKWIALIYNE